LQGRVDFVGTIGELKHPDGTFSAQFRFRIAESTCGTTNTLWSNQWNGSQWAGWKQVAPGLISSDPAAISLAANRMEVFSRGIDDRMYWIRWDGSRWTGWTPLGNEMFTSGPAVASWGPNRLDVFAFGANRAFWTNSWTGGAAFLGWHGDLPRPGPALQFGSDPTAVSWGPNRIDVFARMSDALLYQSWWDNGWNPTGLPWPSRSGLGEGLTSGPAVVSPAPNRLDIFFRGLNNALWIKSWNGGWGAARQVAPGPIESDPGAVVSAAGRIHVFARKADNRLHYVIWDGSPATSWTQVPGDELFTQSPAAISWVANQIVLFARGSDPAERWVHVTSGRLDGAFAHNATTFRNAYNTVMSAFLARTAVHIQVDGFPACDPTQLQTININSSAISLY
jgi:hypothetical protein